MIKIGDIVKILPFEVGCIGGINHIHEMKDHIGEIHVVIKIWGKRITLDASSYYWSDEVLEEVNKPHTVGRYNNIKKVFERVKYDSQNDIWQTESGDGVSPGYIGIIETKSITLPYDIYNVGKAGDEVQTIYFKERYYLSSEYLPMYGIIEVG